MGTTLRSNVRPGITTTTDGSGLLVDYNVVIKGAADNFITLTAGGTDILLQLLLLLLLQVVVVVERDVKLILDLQLVLEL